MDFFRFFRRKRPQEEDRALTDALRNKYSAFQNLLRENNHVLMLMADMEEKLSGEYLFDRIYIETNTSMVSEGVRNIIKYLNDISYDKYIELYGAYENIQDQIHNALTRKTEIQVSDLVIPLENLSGEMKLIAGGKMSHLGEIRNRVGLDTPDGFTITAFAFKAFMEHNELFDRIREILLELRIDDLGALNEKSALIQRMIVEAKTPPQLGHFIKRAYHELLKKNPPRPPMLAVRSSALFEDGEFSFAGQYATYLNVPVESIIHRYKSVIASLFTPRALFYCKTKGFANEDLVMAVGVIEMVEARAGGVAYTKDPTDPDNDSLIINALHGLGKPVVDGTITPHTFTLSRQTMEVLYEKIVVQDSITVCAPDGDIIETMAPEDLKSAPCLSVDQLRRLADCALRIEDHYGAPQDIEWAIGRDNRLYILQSRPLRVSSYKKALPVSVKGYDIIIDKGVIASRGIGCGKAFILRDESDLERFPEGAVLVAKHTSTKFVTIMNKASAIVTDVGSATGHMASLCREYRVPTILGAGNATSLIKDGQVITVDALNCNVYDGRVSELLDNTVSQKDNYRGTRLYSTLENTLKLIVPLNLVDPDAENFNVASCKTFHDITRFAHEVAMREIFKTGKGQNIESFDDLMVAIAFAEAGEAKLGPRTSALRAGIPIDAHLLDIEGGLSKHTKKVSPEDVTSVPFKAFLKGMIGMRWPEARPADVGGFLGMIAHTASIPEAELRSTGGKSYAIVSLNYMNFSIRLGYHFSLVEAYAGDNINDNYIKFFFKGGGAAIDRRLRRVRLIREILKKIGFKVNVKEDVMDASITKYELPSIEAMLEAMGKLTAYTKQLDMALFNDAVTDMFIEDFVRDCLKGFS